MHLEEAPFFDDVAEGPLGGVAHWVTTTDGLRIRIGHWRADGDAQQGTVFLFPGRTEYVEKYGRTAAALAEQGFCTLTVDWRGQGLADRMLGDARAGHVHRFSDYQLDVMAMTEAASNLELPQPWYLMAHSMGGCIGLRALHLGLPVNAAVFTGPMWGIGMSAPLRPAAWALSWGSTLVGLSHIYAPGTKPEAYVTSEKFENNQLTSDPEMYAYMQRQVDAHPELKLGGPSLLWVHEALTECRALAQMPSPDLPCLTFLGTNERIVDNSRIFDRMAHWPGGRLELIEDGEHEVLMETAEIRAQVIGDSVALFREHPTFERRAATA